MKKTIKMDVDGVLRNMVQPLLDITNAIYNNAYTHDDVKKWVFNESLNPDVKYEKFFNSHAVELFQEAPLYNPNTRMLLEQLNRQYKIHIVTHQWKGNEKYTINWLEEHGIPYDGLTFVKDKTRVFGHYLVDDAIHNLKAEVESTPIVFDQPWNQISTFDRVVDLEDLVSFMMMRRRR